MLQRPGVDEVELDVDSPGSCTSNEITQLSPESWIPLIEIDFPSPNILVSNLRWKFTIAVEWSEPYCHHIAACSLYLG